MRLLLALLILLIQACSGSDNIPTSSDAPNTVADLYYGNSNADSINKECENNLTLARNKLDALEALPPPYSIENVLKPLDQLFANIENGTGMMFLLSNVHPDQHLREASDLCVQEFSKLITDIGLSKALYLRVSQVNTQHADAATLRFQNKILSDFKRSGVGQSEETREQLRILNEEIVKLGQDFSKNIRQDVRFINVSPEQLAGLPDDYIKQHPVDNNGFINDFVGDLWAVQPCSQ